VGGAGVRRRASELITKRLLCVEAADSLTTSGSVGSHNRESRPKRCKSSPARQSWLPRLRRGVDRRVRDAEGAGEGLRPIIRTSWQALGWSTRMTLCVLQWRLIEAGYVWIGGASDASSFVCVGRCGVGGTRCSGWMPKHPNHRETSGENFVGRSSHACERVRADR
jgi:hypothetical protein